MIISIISVLLFVQGCRKTSPFGDGVMPPDTKVGLYQTDTFSIRGFTMPEDSLRTDLGAFSLLGSYNDPVFGEAEATLYLQLKMESEYPVFGSVEIDSAVLSLVTIGYYGTTEPQCFALSQLTQDVYVDSAYYSSATPATAAIPLGQSTVIPANSATDSIMVGGVMEAPQVRIRLNKNATLQLLQMAENSGDNGSFINVIKGFRVSVCNGMQSVGTGAIVSLDLTSADTRLQVYYRHSGISPDTSGTVSSPGGATGGQQSFTLIFDETCASFSTFSHDYGSTVVETALSDTSFTDKYYIQSMAGVKTKLYFPTLSSIDDAGPVAINMAELIVPVVQDPDFTTYGPHDNLYIVAVGDEGQNLILPDQLEGDAYYGGVYDETDNSYHFNIARHLQNILNGTVVDRGLFLISGGAVVNAQRTIVSGPANGTSGIRLSLAYTPL